MARPISPDSEERARRSAAEIGRRRPPLPLLPPPLLPLCTTSQPSAVRRLLPASSPPGLHRSCAAHIEIDHDEPEDDGEVLLVEDEEEVVEVARLDLDRGSDHARPQRPRPRAQTNANCASRPRRRGKRQLRAVFASDESSRRRRDEPPIASPRGALLSVPGGAPLLLLPPPPLLLPPLPPPRLQHPPPPPVPRGSNSSYVSHDAYVAAAIASRARRSCPRLTAPSAGGGVEAYASRIASLLLPPLCCQLAKSAQSSLAFSWSGIAGVPSPD